MKEEIEQLRFEVLRLQQLIKELEYKIYCEEQLNKIEDYNLETQPLAGCNPDLSPEK